MHEGRVEGRDDVPVEPTAAVQQHVGISDQLDHVVVAGTHDAVLAAVEGPPLEAVAAVAVGAAARRLDEEDLGPEPGEDHPGDLAAMVRGIDHPVPRQHPRTPLHDSDPHGRPCPSTLDRGADRATMPRMLLAGKVAIVTGAGSGIGRASALRFAAEGALVVAADIRGPKVDETVALITAEGGTAAPCQVNVAEGSDVERMVAFAVETFGGLDALFNNAGTIRPGTAVDLSEQDWDLVMAVNVRSVFLGAKYAVPVLAAGGGGTIVSTASVSGMGGDPASVAYSASKAAVINLTRSLAVDHARQNIRVNCICPGAIDTPPVGRMLSDPEARRRSERAHPLGRIGQPEEIAAAAVWLSSAESAFVTGQALVVDGGLTAQSHLTGMADPRPSHRRPTPS